MELVVPTNKGCFNKSAAMRSDYAILLLIEYCEVLVPIWTINFTYSFMSIVNLKSLSEGYCFKNKPYCCFI